MLYLVTKYVSEMLKRRIYEIIFPLGIYTHGLTRTLDWTHVLRPRIVWYKK